MNRKLFLERDPETELTDEQISMIERRLTENDLATDVEVKALFDQMNYEDRLHSSRNRRF
jgi:hypothetical protein